MFYCTGLFNFIFYFFGHDLKNVFIYMFEFNLQSPLIFPPAHQLLSLAANKVD